MKFFLTLLIVSAILGVCLSASVVKKSDVKKDVAKKDTKDGDKYKNFDYSKYLPKSEDKNEPVVEEPVVEEPVVEEPAENAEEADDDTPVSKFQKPPAAIDIDSLKNPVEKKVEKTLKAKASEVFKSMEADDDTVVAAPKAKKTKVKPAKKDDFDFMQFIPDISAFQKEDESKKAEGSGLEEKEGVVGEKDDESNVEADDDTTILQVAPKKTTFHPLVKKIFGLTISQCGKTKLDCPPSTLFAKTKYLHVECSCEGFRKCQYAKNGTLISNTVGSCNAHHPYNNLLNVCATKLNLAKSTHPTLKAPCNMDFNLRDSDSSEESSGMPE